MRSVQNSNIQGRVIWLYGLSGAGKTTIARKLKEKITIAGFLPIILDGDEIRAGVNSDLTFTVADRTENIRRIAELALLLKSNGFWVICAAITPLKELRTLARTIIKRDFIEVSVCCPIEVCEMRDPKGLYKLTRAKEIKDFSGVDSKFEYSNDADIILYTAKMTIQESVEQITTYLF